MDVILISLVEAKNKNNYVRWTEVAPLFYEISGIPRLVFLALKHNQANCLNKALPSLLLVTNSRWETISLQ